jgi:L-ribulose-5-phosphate 4-epimerase
MSTAAAAAPAPSPAFALGPVASETTIDPDDAVAFATYVDQVRADTVHSLAFLKETGTLSATVTYNIDHLVPGTRKVVAIRFTPPWAKTPGQPILAIKDLSEYEDTVLVDPRFEADTLVHAHTPHLAAWSLAQLDFPIRYVAAQRHLISRTIPNHIDRTRSVLATLQDRLARNPTLAPPPAILESNGGANYWGKGVIKTSILVLLIEEAARYQSIAAGIGGAKDYTPGNLENQWKRTGLLEKSKQFTG